MGLRSMSVTHTELARRGVPMPKKGIAVALLFVASGSVSAYANLLSNGSFEANPPARGCVAGTTTLMDWEITAGNIDIDSVVPICGRIQAPDGNFWVDLTGSFGMGAGTIRQEIATVPGQRYRVSFWFGGNPQGGVQDDQIKKMNLLIDGVVAQQYTVDVTSFADTDPGWATYDLEFIASGPVTRIEFQSLNSANGTVYGPLLDGVRVELLPVTISSLVLNKSVVAGCQNVTGTVTLSDPAPMSGLTVLLSDSLAAANLPPVLSFGAGTTSKAFSLKTVPVSAQEIGIVTASLGNEALTQGLTVRPMSLASITLSQSAVVGGNDVSAKATLECKAGPGPITVDLSSNNPTVASPVATSVVVPQGLNTANFAVTTNAVQARSYATIAGTANSITKSKKLTINVAAAVSPTSLKFGGVPVGTTSGALNAMLINKGAVPFSVGGISLTGTGASWFAQTNNCPASLAPGASCTISVTFTPQAAASKSAKLGIATNATSTSLSVSVSGTGL